MVRAFSVLDASGIIRGSLDFTRGNYLVPKAVLDEILGETTKCALEEAIRRGDIHVIEPGEKSLRKVVDAAKETGDIKSLSKADLDVLALAVERKAEIVSDDYAVQNTATKLKLKTQATTHRGIRREITWVWACIGCGKRMEGPGECAVCGHTARKKPLKP